MFCIFCHASKIARGFGQSVSGTKMVVDLGQLGMGGQGEIPSQVPMPESQKMREQKRGEEGEETEGVGAEEMSTHTHNWPCKGAGRTC
jgi:hypothetical protein